MKVLIDTCVLYPTVMREIVLGVAATGAFTPLWSARILEEWARAARKLGPGGEDQARAEIAILRRDWPMAEVIWPPSLEKRLWLPDPDDVHVLAAAVAGSADVIVTLNASDFPRNVLGDEGLSRADPDAFVLGHWRGAPDLVASVCNSVLAEAQRLSGRDWEMRALLKKARLPRLAKALTTAA
ncbi:RSP_2648 family PIN domain-containing protein [Puniceibacterium sp. IMCC21224]|uniref:RSP_2648 family PIN domain-containing protein n=1 Tax=Puniceibacterium sp. IMCC21224 TaxID=1618204 RepID=UPI00064DD4DA|nr:PIN domain-containing protein [Puniceibacterium sp. IMCC21224]KMK66923.1 PIN domain [Puniceibacterium sp. IMCC21224]